MLTNKSKQFLFPCDAAVQPCEKDDRKNDRKKIKKLLTFPVEFAIIHKLIDEAERAGVAQLVEQLICNQQVGGSSPSTSSTDKLNMGEFPSGQRGQTVNLLAMPSMVRIHLPPPLKTSQKYTSSFSYFSALKMKKELRRSLLDCLKALIYPYFT